MQRCAKTITFAVITAMTIAFLLVFSLSQGLQAGEVAASPKKVLGVDETKSMYQPPKTHLESFHFRSLHPKVLFGTASSH
jgi:hypothetical protein